MNKIGVRQCLNINFDLNYYPEITSIIVIFLLLLTLFIIYRIKVSKQNNKVAPRGFILLMQLFIAYIHNLVIDILGPEFEKTTPYFFFLFSYLICCNLIGITGLATPTGSLIITVSMGLVMWIGMFVIGFKYQRLSYLRKFCICIEIKGKKIPIMINPLEVVGQITPIISISFRLWGNIFAGGLILSLWYCFTGYIFNKIPYLGIFNILGGITSIPLHLYFDLLCGIIQALVFTLLTMVYWTLQKDEENAKIGTNKNLQIRRK